MSCRGWIPLFSSLLPALEDPLISHMVTSGVSIARLSCCFNSEASTSLLVELSSFRHLLLAPLSHPGDLFVTLIQSSVALSFGNGVASFPPIPVTRGFLVPLLVVSELCSSYFVPVGDFYVSLSWELLVERLGSLERLTIPMVYFPPLGTYRLFDTSPIPSDLILEISLVRRCYRVLMIYHWSLLGDDTSTWTCHPRLLVPSSCRDTIVPTVPRINRQKVSPVSIQLLSQLNRRYRLYLATVRRLFSAPMVSFSRL